MEEEPIGESEVNSFAEDLSNSQTIDSDMIVALDHAMNRGGESPPEDLNELKIDLA